MDRQRRARFEHEPRRTDASIFSRAAIGAEMAMCESVEPSPDTVSVLEQNGAARAKNGLPVRCAVVVNRESGTVADLWSERFEAEFLEALRLNGWAPELHLVTGDGIEKTVEAALKSHVEAIFAGGGDGTTTAIANLARQWGVPLGILPFGTMNLAARDLKSPLDPIEAVRALWPGKTRKIDMMEVNGIACLCMTVIGVYPKLLSQSKQFHGRNWWVRVWKIARQLCVAYFRAPKYHLKIQLDDSTERSLSTRFLLIVPGEHQDEWGLIPRRRKLSSGRCTIYISRHNSRWSVLRMVVRFFMARAENDPDLQVEHAKSILITARGRRSAPASVDGEMKRLKLPIQFDLASRELTVLDPRM